MLLPLESNTSDPATTWRQNQSAGIRYLGAFLHLFPVCFSDGGILAPASMGLSVGTA